MGVRALQCRHLVGVEPGRAQLEVCRQRPQVRDDVRRIEQRPRRGSARASAPRSGAAIGGAGRRRTSASSLVDEDRRGAPPAPDRAPRCGGCRAPARRTPLPSPRRPSQTSAQGVSTIMPRSRRLLVERDRRLDRRHERARTTSGARQPGRTRSRPSLPRRRGRAGCTSRTPSSPRPGRMSATYVQVGLVRSDEQHAAAAAAEARVGVQQVGGAVQRHDGLARARAAVDDERAAGSGADDGVLVGLDGREHIAHPARCGVLPRLAMNADWSSSAARPSSPSGVNTSSQ